MRCFCFCCMIKSFFVLFVQLRENAELFVLLFSLFLIFIFPQSQNFFSFLTEHFHFLQFCFLILQTLGFSTGLSLSYFIFRTLSFFIFYHVSYLRFTFFSSHFYFCSDLSISFFLCFTKKCCRCNIFLGEMSLNRYAALQE